MQLLYVSRQGKWHGGISAKILSAPLNACQPPAATNTIKIVQLLDDSHGYNFIPPVLNHITCSGYWRWKNHSSKNVLVRSKRQPISVAPPWRRAPATKLSSSPVSSEPCQNRPNEPLSCQT